MIYLYQTSNKFLAAFLALFMKIQVTDTTSSITGINAGAKNIVRSTATVKFNTENQTAIIAPQVMQIEHLEYKTAGIHWPRAILTTTLGIGLLVSFVSTPTSIVLAALALTGSIGHIRYPNLHN